MKMNIEKSEKNLKLLSDADLRELYQMVQDELDNRSTYMSNTTHTPAEQCRALSQMFTQAWIH